MILQDWAPAVLAAALTVIGVLIGIVVSAWHNSKDLRMRRRVETVKVFLAVSARAHGVREDGTEIGMGERIAAVHLLADLAARDGWLRHAGENQLAEELMVTAPVLNTDGTMEDHYRARADPHHRLIAAIHAGQQHLKNAYRVRRFLEKLRWAARHPLRAVGRVWAPVQKAHRDRAIRRANRRDPGPKGPIHAKLTGQAWSPEDDEGVAKQ
ncbi:hypothetical protein ACH9DO_05100 [Kocuria sp. M1N1S27]|uniref:hypothetical protein n=1 Tax=Kocuria kalidii TaxID=3376283 RepID=UPI003796DB5E